MRRLLPLVLSLSVAATPVVVGACRHSPAANEPPDVQQPAPDAGTPLPNAGGWWRDKVFYEIFVRSFADSNGDGIGDLKGIIAKLDYLNDGDPATTTDLGVDALWLMPIHPSPSYHGYDVTDYRGINPDYGTLADFDQLITEAHKRGIKVVLDFVLNHSSSSHPWFTSARASRDSAYRNFYSWSDTPKPWKNPWNAGPVWYSTPTGYYYALFWSGMPDLNLGNADTEREMTDTARFWLQRGVDGFRVDAARHLFESADGVLVDQPETHAFIKRMRAALQKDFPNVLFVAEAWTTSDLVARYYGEGDEYQLAFAFDLAEGMKTAATDAARVSVQQASTELLAVDTDYGFAAPFLSNHDQVRARRMFGDAPARARVAAAMLFAMPGTPFVYYGEEIGMQGGADTRDEDKRTPMRWSATAPGFGFTTANTTWYERSTHAAPTELAGVDVASEAADDASLWRLYQRLIALRHAEPALAAGAMELPAIDNPGRGVFAALRTRGDKRVLFVTNLHFQQGEPFSVTLPQGVGRATVVMQEGLTAQPEVSAGALSFPGGLGPQSFVFLRLE